MTYEQRLGAGSKVGDYLVRTSKPAAYMVEVLPGGMARATPESEIRPAPAWSSIFEVVPVVEVGRKCELLLRMPDGRGTAYTDLGFVISIEAVEMRINGPLTIASPAGRYQVFTHSERVVVIVGESSCRAAHGVLRNGLGSGYVGDCRMHPTSDFLFQRGDRGVLAWDSGAEQDPAGDPRFTTAEVYRIEWQAPRHRQPM